MKLGTYIKWGMLSPNMVKKLVWLTIIWIMSWNFVKHENYEPMRNGWNDMKLGTYIKWGMLSPNMVKKLVSDCHLINYSWNLSNL